MIPIGPIQVVSESLEFEPISTRPLHVRESSGFFY